MESKVVSVGQMAAPAVHGNVSVPFQPAWMSSSTLAIAITAFIALSAITGGQWAVKVMGISYGWALMIAALIIVAEMFGLFVLIARVRSAYQRKHAEPPVKPLRLAA